MHFSRSFRSFLVPRILTALFNNPSDVVETEDNFVDANPDNSNGNERLLENVYIEEEVTTADNSPSHVIETTGNVTNPENEKLSMVCSNCKSALKSGPWRTSSILCAKCFFEAPIPLTHIGCETQYICVDTKTADTKAELQEEPLSSADTCETQSICISTETSNPKAKVLGIPF